MDFTKIVEDKIRKAYENGEFKNLPGYGKPLPEDDLANVPDDLRMAYRFMKNAGYSLDEAVLKQEMNQLESLIRLSDHESVKEGLKKQLNEKLLRYNGLLSKRNVKTNSSIFKNYESKIEKKFL